MEYSLLVRRRPHNPPGRQPHQFGATEEDGRVALPCQHKLLGPRIGTLSLRQCRCLEEKREIRYAVGGRDDGTGHAEYFRVPVEDLEEPAFYWPDRHPDKYLQEVKDADSRYQRN